MDLALRLALSNEMLVDKILAGTCNVLAYWGLRLTLLSVPRVENARASLMMQGRETGVAKLSS